MTTIFFKLNEKQGAEVAKLMEEEGYTNKSEFFRFLIKFYKYHKSPEEIRFEKAAYELSEILRNLAKKGKLDKYKSLDKQLVGL